MDSQEVLTESVVATESSEVQTQGAAEVAQYVPPKRANKMLSYLIHNWELYAMLIPGMASLFVFSYGPMFGLYIAFIRYDDLTASMFDATHNKFVGWEQFQYMVAFGVQKYIRNTLILSSLKLFLGFPLPIILAILINEVNNKVFKSTFQTVSYMPNFISWVIVAGMLRILIDTDNGIFNQIKVAFGGTPKSYYSNSDAWRPILILSSMWKGMGYASITYLAILTSIDPQLFEAAMIDGANKFSQILHITLPGLAGIISINFINSVGGILGDDVDQCMTMCGDNAAVYDKMELLGTRIYRTAMGGGSYKDYPVSTALGLCQGTCSLILILSTNFVTGKLGGQTVW